jgi:hypothetical protein
MEEKKRKGSRTYRTLTWHYQRNPPSMLYDTHVTHVGAQMFLNSWEKIYREQPEHPVYQGKEPRIVRKHSRVEVYAGELLVMAAYFEEEK